MSETRALESRIELLEEELRGVRRRLDRLEGGAASAVAIETAEPLPAPPDLPDLARLQGVPALLGRTCLVLGGAFLIRALTEAEILAASLGVALGLVYAAVLLALADRAAARGAKLSGSFHALASALVVFPLLFEAATRFALIGAWPAAGLLAIATGAGVAVAWRRSFQSVAVTTLVGALLVGVGLLVATRTALPFVLLLLGVAIGSLALAYGRGWRAQRWAIAVVLDLFVALLGAVLVLAPRSPEWLLPSVVLTAQVGLLVVYLGAMMVRLLVQGRRITGFAVVQTIAVLLVGFEGALLLAGPTGRNVLAAVALAAGAVLHGVLARRSERRWGHGVAVGYFASVATFFAAEGVRVLLPGTFPVLWAAAAVVIAAIALPGKRPILQIHAALLVLAAATASGLVGASAVALTRSAEADWPPTSLGTAIVLALAAATAALLYRAAGPTGGKGAAATVARTSVAVVALVGAGGFVVRLLAEILAAAPGPEADAGMLAVLRSAVVAGAAIVLGLASLRGWPREIAVLAGSLLVLEGLKLLIEDLRVASAAHLVFSLALYGAALIAVPALLRGARRRRLAVEAP